LVSDDIPANKSPLTY